MSRLFIKNIKTLYQISDGAHPVKGQSMSMLPHIKEAYLAIEDGVIVEYGSMNDWPGITDWRNLEVLDATDQVVLPAWCDSHTHLVFAGTREDEFVDRIKGLSYEEIAARGGGILNSAKKLQKLSEDELFASAMQRLQEIKLSGTGAVEIKSGYGLSVEAELKILRVIQRLKKASDLTIKATFLGAHAYPEKYKENHSGYLDLVINDMLPIIASEGLADYIDVFCETNYFSVADTIKIIEAGAKHNIPAKIHVNQFTSIGGIQACVERNVKTVDHLEILTDSDLKSLQSGSTLPVLLPSCSFYLGIPYGPARNIIEADLPLVLATDYNPGSTPSGNVPFLLSLACNKLKMMPEEAINAVTINGAHAMDVSDMLGSISVGKQANIILLKKHHTLNYMTYAFGSQHIDEVILNGKRS